MAQHKPIKGRGVYCLSRRDNHETRTVDYMEQIYEQLIHLNRKMDNFLQFIKYAAVGGFVTTAVYFMLKIGKIL